MANAKRVMDLKYDENEVPIDGFGSPILFIEGEPPPSPARGQGSRWAKRLLALQDRPGVWARVYQEGPDGRTLATSMASRLKSGQLKSMPLEGTYEFKSDVRGYVWAKWTPPHDSR